MFFKDDANQDVWFIIIVFKHVFLDHKRIYIFLKWGAPAIKEYT
jgi:hypothetical protein